ncbi:MAG: hypothetical protein AVDCRST_MAG02-3657, partial [uncultured Rubrobacteraceae bacterium]
GHPRQQRRRHAPLDRRQGPLGRVAPHVRRERARLALHDGRRRGDEAPGKRPPRQHLQRRRPQGHPRFERDLRGEQARRRRHLRGPAPRASGRQHPGDHSRAGRGRDGAGRPPITDEDARESLGGPL